MEQVNPVGQAWAAATVIAVSSGVAPRARPACSSPLTVSQMGAGRRAGRASACAVGWPSLTRCPYLSGHEAPLSPWPASPWLWSLEGEVREHSSWKCSLLGCKRCDVSGWTREREDGSAVAWKWRRQPGRGRTVGSFLARVSHEFLL